MNLTLPAIFLIWALISFSRGGVISAILALVLIILLVPKGNKPLTPRRFNPGFIIGFGALLAGSIYYVNRLTNNLLYLRYTGESQGTLAGTREKDFDLLTTGRWEIFLSDLQIWSDNLLFGVGVGQSAGARPDYGFSEIIAHVEISRLLSEHGLFGFFISLIFILTPLILFIRAKTPLSKAFLILCFTLAIATSMHSAMRTFITPYFYGLAFIQLISVSKDRSNIIRH